MIAPRITVVASRYVKGGDDGAALTAPLGAALERTYSGDAHMQCATSPLGVRLTRQHVGTAPIRLQVLAFDLDAPGHAATPEWRAELHKKVEALLTVHAGGYFYETRNGARLVYALAEPFEIRSDDDARAWTARYSEACNRLEGFELFADRSCSEWQRLYRLPHATRQAGAPPESLLTLGDPNAIGTFPLPLAPASLASRPPLEAPGVNAGSQDGRPPHAFLLHTLLDRRGDVLRARADGAFVIRCPRRRLHGVGRDGDGSTLLYPPSGSGYGAIHCKHSSCSEARIADWLAALGADAPTLETRIAVVERVAVDTGSYGVRVVLMLGPADDQGPLPCQRLRIYTAPAARWRALWEAAGVEPPSDCDPAGDLGEAAAELCGKRLALEIDSSPACVNPVRRILPAPATTKSEAA